VTALDQAGASGLEVRDRTGFAFPADRITVNLAPAALRKEGTSFDLPIALGVLAATGAVTNGRIGPFAVVGELALDGQIQAVRGVLAVGLACRRQGIDTLVVPVANHSEAQAVEGLRVLGAPTLRDAVGLLNGDAAAATPPTPEPLAGASWHKGKKGAKAQWEGVSPAQRREIARKAARARWASAKAKKNATR